MINRIRTTQHMMLLFKLAALIRFILLRLSIIPTTILPDWLCCCIVSVVVLWIACTGSYTLYVASLTFLLRARKFNWIDNFGFIICIRTEDTRLANIVCVFTSFFIRSCFLLLCSAKIEWDGFESSRNGQYSTEIFIRLLLNLIKFVCLTTIDIIGIR